MKAWVIKCNEGGYHHKHGCNIWPVMDIFRTQKEALEDACKGDEVIPVEIKEITETRRRKKKRKVKIHYRTIHETIACGRSFISDTFTSAIVKRKVTCDACRNTIEFRKKK